MTAFSSGINTSTLYCRRGDGFNGAVTTSSYSVYGDGRGLDINAEDAKPVDCFHFPCLQFGFKNKNKIKPLLPTQREENRTVKPSKNSMKRRGGDHELKGQRLDMYLA